MTRSGEVLWTPTAERVDNSRLRSFTDFVTARYGVSGGSYRAMLEWSTSDIADFWTAVAQFFDIHWTQSSTEILRWTVVSDARWFEGGSLNYAEHILRGSGDGHDSASVAVTFVREDGVRIELSWSELRQRVGSVRAWLVDRGVKQGDRVAALLPNAPDALIAMLATASIGAIWACCSPEFGVAGILERLSQIEPRILFAVDGYVYGGQDHDVLPVVEALIEALPTLRDVVLVPYLDHAASLEGATEWRNVVESSGELAFTSVPFETPLLVLYTSGTTGIPKAIVHSHGGILLEHFKLLGLHMDLGPKDTFFWFTTTAWVMWNIQVSGLLCGSRILLYDGKPSHPDPNRLWQLAADERVTALGVSAAYLTSCMQLDVRPRQEFPLASLRTVGSTGSPLSSEAFAWVYEAVGDDLVVISLSGGTDVCTAFVGGAPTLPVRAGQIACAHLGCSVEVWNSEGKRVFDELGELVVTKPMPSMPVRFWNDLDGTRRMEAYFDTFPGVWRHGDWATETSEGSWIIHGRSDATLNRGGIRMGTSEFYAVLDGIEGIVDSMVIDAPVDGPTSRLIAFVSLADGVDLKWIAENIRVAIASSLSPRHVPDLVIEVPEIPRTLTNKRCEIPVKRVLAGGDVANVVNVSSLQNPDSMAAFANLENLARVSLRNQRPA